MSASLPGSQDAGSLVKCGSVLLLLLQEGWTPLLPIRPSSPLGCLLPSTRRAALALMMEQLAGNRWPAKRARQSSLLGDSHRAQHRVVLRGRIRPRINTSNVFDPMLLQDNHLDPDGRRRGERPQCLSTRGNRGTGVDFFAGAYGGTSFYNPCPGVRQPELARGARRPPGQPALLWRLAMENISRAS